MTFLFQTFNHSSLFQYIFYLVELKFVAFVGPKKAFVSQDALVDRAGIHLENVGYFRLRQG